MFTTSYQPFNSQSRTRPRRVTARLAGCCQLIFLLGFLNLPGLSQQANQAKSVGAHSLLIDNHLPPQVTVKPFDTGPAIQSTKVGLTSPAKGARLAAVSTETFNYSGAIVIYTVPNGVTSLTIEAKGAEGSNSAGSTYRPGKGAIITGTIAVIPGQQLKVLVGQQFSATGSNGGGGGSFVTDINNNPLVIAGGGGGSGNADDASSKQGQAGNAGGNGANNGGAGGTGPTGTGGEVGPPATFPSGGGGGLSTNGATYNGFPTLGGKAFINGGAGGSSPIDIGTGGFGGGGNGSSRNPDGYSGGGGGGFSGGGSGGSQSGVGGGGGSYNAGINQTNVAGANSGNGVVVFSYTPCQPFTVNLQTDGQLTCAKNSVKLTATGGQAGATYVFNGPSVSGVNSNTANAGAIGQYSVTVTNPYGCPAVTSSPVTVTENKTPPQAVRLDNGGGLTCLKTSTSLTPSSGTSGATFVLSGPSLSGNTATGPGRYTVTATDPTNGCSATATTQVTQNIDKPMGVSLGNDGGLTCLKTSVKLTAGTTSPQAVSYQFSGPAVMGTNGNTANVTAQGEYTVTITRPDNGCSATASNTVSENKTPPQNVQLTNGGQLTCLKTSTSLTPSSSSDGVTFFLSGPSVNGTNATAPGQYMVTATRADNGCTATATTDVSQNIAPPTGVQLTNSGSLSVNKLSVTLSASSPTSGVTYSFSNGAQKTGDNTASVTTSGTYTVTAARSDNGCTATATTTVLGAASPTVCRNGTATINLTAAGSPVRYEWYLNAPLGSVLRDGSFYAGATTPSLTVVNIQQTSIYYAKVYYADGSSAAYGPYRVNVNLGCNGRIGVTAEAGAELRITLLGNPLQGEALRALVEGAAGQRLHVELLDVSGHPLRSQVFESAESAQAVEWNLSTAGSGLYLLQAVSGTQRNSVKVVKP